MVDMEKQTRLEGILRTLAEKTSIKDDLLPVQREIHALYADKEWRHLYSEIYLVLADMAGSMPEQLDNLSNNMWMMENELTWQDVEIQRKWHKLLDHVNLDIARFRQFNTLQGYTAEMNARLTSQESRLTAVDTELRTAQTNYITILGIFAAIVLTLAGSISFTNAAFSNLMTAPPLRLFAACGIQLLLIVNVTYCLTASILPEKLPVKQNLQNWIRWFNITLIVGGCAALTLYLLLNAPEPETNCPILNFFL